MEARQRSIVVKTLFALLISACAGFCGKGIILQSIPSAPTGPSQMQLWKTERAVIDYNKSRVANAKDAWRVINGTTNRVSEKGWVFFSGKVLQVHADGIRIDGRYGEQEKEFFVRRFPYVVAEDEYLSPGMNLAAKESGTYSYTTVLKAERTLRELDFGTIWTPPAPEPLSANQILAARKKSDEIKSAAEKKAFDWNMKRAEKGDAYGQLRVGECYRDGQGVETDIQQARAWLKKAASQGQNDAIKALSKLDSQELPESSAPVSLK